MSISARVNEGGAERSRDSESFAPRAHTAAEARARLVEFQEWFLGTELRNGAPHLPEPARAAFLDYYRGCPAHWDGPAVGRYLRALWRSDAGWVSRWIAAQKRTPLVLDAGCGFGQFALMYAAVGAEVDGVDLRPDRLESARLRLEQYRATTGRSLPAWFERADVTQNTNEHYDMVWVYNALSHIEPLEPFFQSMRAQLARGGLLVIGDINGGHPAHAKHLATVRTEVVQEYVAPDGERHAYAMERAFTPGSLSTLVRAQGFTVKRHELYYGGVASLPGAAWALMKPLQRHAGWNGRFAMRQMLVATPR